jgi:hypothetical protein
MRCSPALSVLLRPDGAVQLGWSPRRELHRHSDLTAGELDDLLVQLVAAGTWWCCPTTSSPTCACLRDLNSQGVAHLAVRVRDGTGLVGPPVVPMTSRVPRMSGWSAPCALG